MTFSIFSRDYRSRLKRDQYITYSAMILRRTRFMSNTTRTAIPLSISIMVILLIACLILIAYMDSLTASQEDGESPLRNIDPWTILTSLKQSVLR